MTNLEEFVTVLTGDSIHAAISENRCVREPIGCGKPVMEADGNLRHTMPDDGPDQYIAEWQMYGLCADCQDDVEELLEARWRESA